MGYGVYIFPLDIGDYSSKSTFSYGFSLVANKWLLDLRISSLDYEAQTDLDFLLNES